MICQVCGHEQDRGRFCRRCGARVEPSERPAAIRPWTRPERWVPAAIALLVLALVLGRLVGPRGTDADGAVPTVPAGGMLFPDPTGTVLFLDAGSGVVGLDLDTGATEQVEVAGRSDDASSYGLWRLGPELVVDRDGAVVVSPGVEGATRTLGRASRFLPAADPQQLWLLDDRDPTGVWRLVAASGRVVASIEAIAGYEAVRGLPRGLAFRDGTGRLWRYDIAEDVLVEALGGASSGWIGDVVRSQVAWCSEDPCRSLTVADAGGAGPMRIGAGETFSEGQVWLSPAGDHVAAVVLAPATDGAGVDRRLRVYRTATGEVLADSQVPLGAAAGSWTVDGRQFFGSIHAGHAGAEAPAVLLRWAGAAIDAVDARRLAVPDVRRIVAVPRSAVPGAFDAAGTGCAESERSGAMGSLPAWRGEQVHVALLGPGGAEPPDQLWVGIPGAGSDTSLTLSARLVDDDVQAGFRMGAGADWRAQLTVGGGRRTADGFPPHWGFASRFPVPGCWAVTVSTEELTETVTMEIRFDAA